MGEKWISSPKHLQDSTLPKYSDGKKAFNPVRYKKN